MLFDVVLFSSLLFTFIAKAVPHWFAPQFAHRRQTTAIRGAIGFHETNFIFNSIGTDVLIPSLNGNVGDRMSFGIALDSAGCQYGPLQLIITATVSQDGTRYSAMYYENASNSWQPMNFDISTEDTVHMAISINASDMTSGRGIIENLTKGSAAVPVQLTRSTNSGNKQPCGHSLSWFASTVGSDLNAAVEFLNAGAGTTTEGMLHPSDPRAEVTHNDNVVVGVGAADSIIIHLVT